MRVAHFCRFSPDKSGQYSTVRDIIKGECDIGIDAGMIATLEEPPMFFYDDKPLTDGTLTTKNRMWAKDADVFVRHTTIPPLFASLSKPSVMCLHGRPENSFMLGHLGKMPVYYIIAKAAQEKEHNAFVTFWDEYKFHWELLIDNQIVYSIPSPVDLNRYSPDGDKFYWGDKSGSPNIVIADMWREDTTPYNAIHAAAYYIRNMNKDARLHIFGFPPPKVQSTAMLGGLMQHKNIMGHICETMPNIEVAYRAADMVITPHRIATRIVREALACNTPVIAGGCKFATYNADPRNPKAFAEEIAKCWGDIQAAKRDRGKPKMTYRAIAEASFNPKKTAEGLLAVFKKVLNDRAGELEEQAEKLRAM